MYLLKEVTVPRYIAINETSELHIFVDASKSSYGVCVFVRTVVENAERVLIRLVQDKMFPNLKSIPIVNVFKDNEGIIRVKTKITERKDPNFISPVLMPSKCLLTTRLIEYYHLKLPRAGVQILLREKFWIIKTRKTVREVVMKCVPCRRYSSNSSMSEPASLAADRVKDANAFDITGIDLAGPLFTRDGGKVWIVLYTCAIYRAIHLELVSSLSTECFMLSSRRFIARRTRPETIYTDNGTNFVGTNSEFKNLDWDKIMQETDIKPIKWKFNPPTTAWWGGWRERLVRVIKELLKRTLGQETVFASSFYSQNGLSTISELPLHDDKGRYRPEKSITDSQKDLSQLNQTLVAQPVGSSLSEKPHRKNVPEISSFLDSHVEMNQLRYIGKKKFQMAFLEKAKKQDLVLLAEELGQKVSDKMTIIDLKNIIIGSKDYEEEFVKAQLSVISEERVERETEEKIARQHAIQQLRWESELNELRLEIESIRSNVKRTSCAEDRKKTSSNYRISIGRAGEHMRETYSAVLMAEATIPVTTPIKEEKGMGGDDLRVVHVKVKGEQGILNVAIDTGAQIPVVTADVVEGQSVDNKGTIQITSAFWEHEIGEVKDSNMELNDLRHGVVPVSKNLVNDMLICSSDFEGLIGNWQMVRNPAILREPSGEEGIINLVNSKSVCNQEVVTDLLPETQSLLNVPNGDLVAVKINGSNVQTNGQGIKESKVSFQLHRPGMTDELFKGGGVGVGRPIDTS
ncbi:putative RNA-directed DNA polymerase from transposon X-element [Trichonephila clavipes]|nr:putative RNA-directed DNA polymerase from transposon X-element [Trichonephila clavipes]